MYKFIYYACPVSVSKNLTLIICVYVSYNSTHRRFDLQTCIHIRSFIPISSNIGTMYPLLVPLGGEFFLTSNTWQTTHHSKVDVCLKREVH